MKQFLIKRLQLLIGLVSLMLLNQCGPVRDHSNEMIVSVKDQKMLLLNNGQPVKMYHISTSKFGLGDAKNSNKTPLGRMMIAKKIGDGQPAGAVFKSRRPTGEVLKPNAPGRDPIVSRIMWLEGTESFNNNTYNRFIYIHGTPVENQLGSPASYGCIRMGMRDVVDLYNRVGVGARVYVIRERLNQTPMGARYAARPWNHLLGS